MRSLLEQLAGVGSLLLVLDDVQFADAASVELLASLVRRLPDAPVLLALAYRPGRGPLALSRELVAAERSGRLQRIEVGPLSRAETELLMAGTELRQSVRALLHEQSAGNPFYLEQLIRWHRDAAAAGEPGDPPPEVAADSLGGSVPPLIARVMAQEVVGLPASAQTVIRAAAVAGEPFEVELVADIAELDESGALVALDELQERELIRATATAREFRFRHPLTRAAVYSSLRGGWRVAAHARAAGALARRGASVVSCASHVEQSARRGDADAIDLLVEAARLSTGRAPAVAARWLRAALRLTPTRGQGSERRLELMQELAAVLMSIGALEHGHDLLVQTLELAADASEDRRIVLLTGCAQAEIWLGRHEDARRRLMAALSAAGTNVTPAVVHLEVELAAYGAYANDPKLAVGSARRALEGARRLGRDGLHAAAAAVLSLSAYAGAEIAEAEEAHSQASRLVAGLRDESLARRAELLWFLGWAGWFLGRFAPAEAHLARGIAVSRASGDARLLTELSVGRSIALTWMGRLREAVDLSEEALEAAGLNGNPNQLLWCHIARCLSLAASGQVDDAVAAGVQAVAIARQLGVPVLCAGAGWTCAAALIEAGRNEQAVDLLLEMLGGAELANHFAGMKPMCYGLLTRAELGRDDPAAARQWAARADEAARAIDLELGRAYADLSLAEVTLDGEAARAYELANYGAGALERAGAVLASARGRLLAGKALVAMGERDRGGDALRTAERTFAGAGAERLRAEAVRELRRIGRRVGRTGHRGEADGDAFASLSGREREVAELVTSRKTNREIAAQLYLSEKTVETHLSSIFVKLGVRSRVEVAHVVEHARSAARAPGALGP